MNLQAIFVANITGFLLILFLFVSKSLNQTKESTEDNAFRWMMILVMIACVVEPLTFAIDGVHSIAGYWINILGNTYLYYANGVGSFLWMMYIDLKLFHDRSRIRRIYWKISVPVSVLLLFLIGNIWGHYFFYVDENYVYHRLPMVYIFYGYITLCIIYSIVLYFYRWRVGGRLFFFPIYMYLGPVVASSLLQMVFYGISLAWLGAALGIVGLYMTIQQQNMYIDSMTGLYNRMFLERMLYKMQRSSVADTYGLMIDLNDFKDINDTYGHSIGNQALQDMATIFSDTVSRDATVFRYAGDEFVIITKAANEQEIQALIDDLHRTTDEFNEHKTRPYHLSFSIGFSHFQGVWDNSDSFLKRIDEAMYLDKRKYHESH